MFDVKVTPAADVVAPTATGLLPEAPLAVEVATPVAPASDAPILGSGTTEDPVIVAPGTFDTMKELASGGYDMEKIEKFLESQPEGLREKLRDALAGKSDLEFREQEKQVAPATEAKPNEFVPLTDEELEKADPRLKAYHATLQAMAEEVAARPALPPEVEQILQDPAIAHRLEQMKSGTPETLPSFSDLFDADKFNTDVLELIQAGSKDEAIALVNEVASEYAKKLIMDRDSQWADKVKAESAAKDQAFAEQVAYQTLTSKIEAMTQEVPEFKSQLPLWVAGPDGKPTVNPAHPANDYVQYLAEMERAGLITDKLIIQKGAGYAYDAWKSEKAGGRGVAVAQQRQSIVQDVLSKMKKGAGKALAPYTAQTLGANGTAGVQANHLHGVNLDLASQLTSEGMEYGRKVVSMLQGDSKKLDEVYAAIKRIQMGQTTSAI